MCQFLLQKNEISINKLNVCKIANKNEQSKEKKEKNERKITALLVGKLQVERKLKVTEVDKKSRSGLKIPEVDKYLNVK